MNAKNKRLKDWMTKGLLISVRHKQSLSMKCKKHPNNIQLNLHYKKFKNNIYFLVHIQFRILCQKSTIKKIRRHKIRI